MVGISLTLSPGSLYRSKYGTLMYEDQDKMSFQAATATGAILAKLILAIKKVKPLIGGNSDQEGTKIS